ncbi:MAG: hypothetical protein EZS28_003179 [Streblomastix strix]|uniref:Uncharacterized protein n=1 Tax=Streblomastix strix TaxID=222440 RepID=A0A5J4X219_9EUKA|nr:MAG: hypothetical protein EZS28_003179 [Streblomastix strix]
MQKDLSPTDKLVLGFDPFLFEIRLDDFYSEQEYDIIADTKKKDQKRNLYLTETQELIVLEKVLLIMDTKGNVFAFQIQVKAARLAKELPSKCCHLFLLG